MSEKGPIHGNKMPNERTPLIQTVPVAEPADRYPHTAVRRLCTIALITIPLVVLAAFAGISIFQNGEADVYSAFHSTISYDKLKHILKTTPSGDKAREWSKYYTAGPHLAGKNLSQAEWTRDKWSEFGVDHAEVVSYEVYLNYPKDHRLALLENGEVSYEAVLEEDVIEEDPTTSLEDRVPTFHGYSASGNVTAPYVFVNYATYADFEELQKANVSLSGKIALVKYGGIFRGLKVKRASELGMVGVIIYSDPGDDGLFTEKNGYAVYPDGPARQPSSVQRGSVEYLSFVCGDPTTVGYPSKPGVPRQSLENKIPDIPSLPISYLDALPLLRALNGHGPNAADFSSSWHTGGLDYKGVEYNIGPSPDSLTINLVNEQEYVTTPLWNAIGIINGTDSDEVVIVGNHRDAWIAGGAADPNSGSAALNEVVRSFGEALATGWRPRRTIVFASWDGEEYGLIGSTEWVEEFLPWLSTAAVAYINVDVGATGRRLGVSAAPLLNKAIYEVTSEIQSPNQTIPGQTVRDLWSGHISTIGSGSDFTAFQDFAGIPSIDIGFKGGYGDAVYHYHSNYDSFHYMEKFGDPGFEYHATIAKIAALLAAKFAEEPVVQFNATDYAVALGSYLERVKDTTSSTTVHTETAARAFKQLESAIAKFHKASVSFDAEASRLSQALEDTSLTAAQRSKTLNSVRNINKKYKYLEREFLYKDGLDGRSWFRHTIYAPGVNTGYAGATYPGLVEALDADDEVSALRWAGIISDKIDGAAKALSKHGGK